PYATLVRSLDCFFLRLAERMQAGGVAQMGVLIKKARKALLPPGVSQRPWVEHAVRAYDIGPAAPLCPPPRGNRKIHPQSMHVQKINVARLKPVHEPWRVAERGRSARGDEMHRDAPAGPPNRRYPLRP